MTDEEKIEVAAQAIHQANANQSGRARDWRSLVPRLQQAYREEASAALLAVGAITKPIEQSYLSRRHRLDRAASKRAESPKLEADEIGEGVLVVDPTDPDAGRVWTDDEGVDG